MEQAILTSAYLGSVGYYTILALYDNILIEQYESYHKQTLRNHCRVMGANGPLDLIIPVVNESGRKTHMKDVKIDYATRWQNIHWRSLSSSYNSSPFFEYYAEYFMPFYQKRWTFLLDYNIELMDVVFELLQLQKNFILTDRFQKEYETVIDLRNEFSPKKNLQKVGGDRFNFVGYTQTFTEKFDFVPDLSIADLLFNCGPDSESILRQNSFKI